MTDNICGSSQCLIDGLKETVREQHMDSQVFMKDLLNTTKDAICRDLDRIRMTVKDQGDEVFTRLRVVENKVTSIETRIGPTEITDRIAAEILRNPDVAWIKEFRRMKNAVMIVVTAGAIISFGTFILMLVDRMNLTKVVK